MNTKPIKDLLQAPRGMRDFYGDAFIQRKLFFAEAESIAESYGFSGIETPIMEHTEIFQKAVGAGTDIVDKEMYNLETIGGDRLTLRPEGTAAIIRAYIEHGMGSLPSPQMLYYSGPFFRHDKPQKGRYRQLYQFGLEIMGSRDAMYDSLIIQTGYEIISHNGDNVIVKINSLGNYAMRQQYIIVLKKFYTENKDKLSLRDIERIETNPFRILDSKEPETVLLNATAPTLIEHLDVESNEHFNNVIASLDSLNIPYVIDPFLVRGMDYYEHTVFEYVTRDNNGNESLALGGGGRYDGLAEMIGHNQSIPAVGLGLGADRIVESSEKNKNIVKTSIPLLLADISAYVPATKIIQKIRKNNNIFLLPLTQKIAKQISRVEKEGYKNILILGENEIANNTIILKNLEKRDQQEIAIDDLSTLLQEL